MQAASRSKNLVVAVMCDERMVKVAVQPMEGKTSSPKEELDTFVAFVPGLMESDLPERDPSAKLLAWNTPTIGRLQQGDRQSTSSGSFGLWTDQVLFDGTRGTDVFIEFASEGVSDKNAQASGGTMKTTSVATMLPLCAAPGSASAQATPAP